MGVHTGDSITVAPQQTLTNDEYQAMRDEAKRIIRAIGVETGGSNIQFAVHPTTGRRLAIEMNPRVSRSSALASKATGFPIAKFAAKLAAGYTLDEIPNDITKKTPASFEPSIDYVVVKIPRFAFEKFRNTPPHARPSRCSRSASRWPSAARSTRRCRRACARWRSACPAWSRAATTREKLPELLRTPTPERIFAIGDALRDGMTVEEIYAISTIDPLVPARDAQDRRRWRARSARTRATREMLRAGSATASPTNRSPRSRTAPKRDVREERHALGVRPVYKRVDTCAAEFEAIDAVPLLDLRDTRTKRDPTSRRKVMILGSGPNRIGQGIEFDTCCVHASFALREIGFETIMVNCNPETVSTDYDTSDRLYFEPLTLEDVLEIVELEKPEGVIVQFGGQTPLKLAKSLAAAGVPMWGTSVDSIDIAEDRERFGALVQAARHPRARARHGDDEAEAIASRAASAFRSSSAPRTSSADGPWPSSTTRSRCASTWRTPMEAAPGHPILIDRFLEDAIEIDVDAISDGTDVVIAGVMQHIEEAGIHSGDSTTVIPPYIITQRDQDRSAAARWSWRKALNVIGLMNVQYAIYNGDLYVLEVNPRASRTVPYVSKATGVPFAKIAAKVMAGDVAALARHHERAARRRLLRQGAGLPVQPLPARGHGPRPGDEVDRRGDGLIAALRRGVREGAARRGRRSCRCGGTRVHLRQRQRQARRSSCSSRAICTTSASS